MKLRKRLTVYSVIAACVFAVTVPLVSEATKVSADAWITAGEASDTVSDVTEPVSETEADTSETAPPEESTVPDMPDSGLVELKVYISKEDKTVTMSLEDYIVCVVAAEMPYTFHTEALKAQAVAARSYCLYKLGSASHKDGADVCTDYSHCAAYVSQDELIARYGKTVTERILTKIENAVKETAGEIITWNGKPALAVFHSSSYKTTESSKNIWGGDLPYLVSVSTPEEDRISTVTLTDSQIASLFSSQGAIKVDSSGKKGIYTTKNDSGRAEYICLSGLAVNAKLLRQNFGFKSLIFEYAETESGWTFTVHGHGHGVGMSQYGANEMAKNGSTYDEILKHYYTGVKIENIQ